MCHRINARAGCDASGLRKGQFRVQNRHLGHRLRITAGHLGVRDRIGNQRKTLALTARAGGGGNCNERQHRLGRLAHTPVILYLAAIGEQEITSLGGVHRTTAA